MKSVQCPARLYEIHTMKLRRNPSAEVAAFMPPSQTSQICSTALAALRYYRVCILQRLTLGPRSEGCGVLFGDSQTNSTRPIAEFGETLSDGLSFLRRSCEDGAKCGRQRDGSAV